MPADRLVRHDRAQQSDAQASAARAAGQALSSRRTAVARTQCGSAVGRPGAAQYRSPEDVRRYSWGSSMNGLARFAGLNGRVGRLHYWLLLAAAVLIVFVAATLGSLNLESQPIQWLSYGILLSSGWPVLSATTRRLRDAALSHWYLLLLVAIPLALQLTALVFSSAELVLDIASAAVTILGFIALGLVPGRTRRSPQQGERYEGAQS
jgi:uncharacterized membrane protein YhaH (DUF805 family)